MNHQIKAHFPKENLTSFRIISYYPDFKVRIEGMFPKEQGLKTEERKKGRE